MSLPEFNACVRGFLRANGGGEEASRQEIEEFRDAMLEAERLGLV